MANNMVAKTQAILENILIEKYGIDNLEKSVCHEGRDCYKPGIKLTLYYTVKPINEFTSHAGTYNHTTKQGVWFNHSDPESLGKPVRVGEVKS
jgi:hypothetical protein